MGTYTVAVIGTGPDPTNPTVEGYAMGYRHAEAFEADDRCELVGCADVVPENAAAFAETFDLSVDATFADYRELIEALDPDVVSVAVPPGIHAEIVVGCAEHDGIRAIHCEKPMALTWGDARRMVDACDGAGVQLTFNRQRRFGRVFTEADRLVDEGEIGDLTRVEIGWGDFFDTGAHTVDLAHKFADEAGVEWVLAGLDYREEDRRFGAHQENQIWAQWRYESGVYGVASTGGGADFTDAAMVLRGTEGTIRIDQPEGPMLELQRGGERDAIDVGEETMHHAGTEGDDRFGSYFHDRAVASLVDALETGGESEIRAELGLRAAEVLFAGYESVRRRGRVDLPLTIEDGPLEAMVENGALTPTPQEEDEGADGAADDGDA